MAETRILLEPDHFYHIYNHAVGKELLFKSDENYSYFLRLVKKYLLDYVDFYAYCLMPNHFHFIIRINNGTINDPNLPKVVSRQFSHLFNSYAQAFNKQERRRGSLFKNRYKRKRIDSDEYLIKLIHYVHYNPVKAKLCIKVNDWRFSSYNSIISEDITIVKSMHVIDLFNDLQNFIYCHAAEPSISGIDLT